MKEYGNYFHIEDMNIYPFNNGGFLGDAVKKANKESCIDRKIHIVRNAVQVLFNEAKERNEAKIGVVSHGKFKVFYVVFDYNGVVYYWWERYEMQIPFMSDFSSCSKLDDLEFAWDCDILSGDIYSECIYTLEFLYRTNPVMTYVGFSSNSNQSPLMCVGEFQNIKL